MISYEELMELMCKRRSVRRYSDRPVSTDDIRKMIEAAVQAPSASNRQDWRFAVVTSRERIEKLADAAEKRWASLLADMESDAVSEELGRYARNFSWFGSAPALIVITCRKPESFLRALLGDEAHVVSGAFAGASMAAQNILLAAESLGLATCCLTGPLAASGEIRSLLGIGSNRRIVCMIAVGYAGETPSSVARKKAAEVMRIVE